MPVVFMWINEKGNFYPITKAANTLGIDPRQLINILIEWELNAWKDGFKVLRFGDTYKINAEGDHSYGEVIKIDRAGETVARVSFSLEVCL